jgi:hypothetical protein
MNSQDIFNNYTGQEVNVIERKVSVAGYHFVEAELDNNDPVIKALCADFQKAGISNYRILTPAMVVAMDYDESRLNVNIDKGGDDKYRIVRFGRG